VLAILSTVGGLIGIPYALGSLVGAHVPNYFEQTLEPAIAHPVAQTEGAPHANEAPGQREPKWLSPAPPRTDGAAPLSVGEGSQGEAARERAHSPEELNAERLFTLISVAIAIAGIALGWFIYRRRPLLAAPRILEEKYYVDEIYNAGIINPIKDVSRVGLWRIVDVNVIDYMVNGIGRGITEIGSVVRYLQVGFVRWYAALILLGAVAVLGYFAFMLTYAAR
jgi:NADH:ubiquinone oxidoreductase subunit 5 (subunit L)/multisubunit Na+/H+ antiporter MnhA subunit